jgi:TonB family protein
MDMLKAAYISLAFHLVLFLIISLIPPAWTQHQPAEVTEIEIVNKPFNEKNTQQIVRQPVVPEKMKLHDEADARFLSEQRQRVLLETKARKTGLTQNSDPNRPRPPEPEKKPPQQTAKLEGYEPIRLPRPNEILNEGSSTVGEALPNDIALGSFTALNTDRFQFYSFYSRVEELVRFRWETQVRTAVDAFDRKYVMNHIGNRNWITQIEFLITPDGHLKGALLMKESGIKSFDEAAAWAFRDARFFPNPPKEMIEADGMIHLKYSFNVYFEPSAFASSQ